MTNKLTFVRKMSCLITAGLLLAGTCFAAENEKVNYVTKTGLAQAKKLAESLTKEAVDVLDGVDGDTEFLRELALSLSHRLK